MDFWAGFIAAIFAIFIFGVVCSWFIEWVEKKIDRAGDSWDEKVEKAKRMNDLEDRVKRLESKVVSLVPPTESTGEVPEEVQPGVMEDLKIMEVLAS